MHISIYTSHPMGDHVAEVGVLVTADIGEHTKVARRSNSSLL
jgi:hypothetical protein